MLKLWLLLDTIEKMESRIRESKADLAKARQRIMKKFSIPEEVARGLAIVDARRAVWSMKNVGESFVEITFHFSDHVDIYHVNISDGKPPLHKAQNEDDEIEYTAFISFYDIPNMERDTLFIIDPKRQISV